MFNQVLRFAKCTTLLPRINSAHLMVASTGALPRRLMVMASRCSRSCRALSH